MNDFNFSGHKCPCPHCRGGHAYDFEDEYEVEFYADDEYEDEDYNEHHIAEGYSEEVEIVRFDTPEVQEHIQTLITAYLEGIDVAKTYEEKEQLMLAMYSEIFNYSYSVALREKAFQLLDAVQDMKDKGYIP